MPPDVIGRAVVSLLVSIDGIVVVPPVVSGRAVVSLLVSIGAIVVGSPIVMGRAVVAPLVSIGAIVVVPLVSVGTVGVSLVPSVVTGKASASFCATNIAKSAVRTIFRLGFLKRHNMILVSEAEIYENT